MNISEFFIRRPVFAIVINLILIVTGLVFAQRLEIRGTPDIDPPVITVQGVYSGADALYMEDVVTKPLERALKTTKNLDKMVSASSNGAVQISMSFDLEADLDSILSDIRSKIADVSYQLPDDMRTPTAARFDSDGFPSIWIAVSSDIYSGAELTEIIDDNIKAPLERIGTVGEARIYGGSYYSMMIEPDPVKLYQHKMPVASIANAISAQTKNYPAGRIKTDSWYYNLRMDNVLSGAQDFKDIILKKDGEYLLKLGEIADIEFKSEDKDTTLRYNRNSAIAVGVIKQSGSNLVTLSGQVRAELAKIKDNLPAGVYVEIANDSAVPVKASIRAVFVTIFEALLFVMAVTWLFLSSARITVIPFVTIPISLIATFSIMHAFGFSINNFTLLALILAIGLVVDDAIVMMENILRYMQKGVGALEAAITGARQITSPIIAMTLTLASVFIPVGFIEGFVGKLFIEFAWTLAFCVLFSGFVALTLTPMMCRYMGQGQKSDSFFILQKFNDYFEIVKSLYLSYLAIALKDAKKYLAIASSSIIILVISFIYVDKTFVPEEDSGFLRVAMQGLDGTAPQVTKKTALEAEQIFAAEPDLKGSFVVINPGSAFAFLPLLDWGMRARSQFEIKDSLNAKLLQIPGMKIFAINPRSIGGFFGSVIEFTIYGGMDYDQLGVLSKKIISQMNESGIFVNVDSDLKLSIPALDIKINKDKTYLYGLSLADVGSSVQYLFAGKSAGDFRRADKSYNVRLRLNRDYRSDIKNLDYIWINNDAGNLIPLSNVAGINEVPSAKSYNHFNSSRALKITADLKSGVNVQQALSAIQDITASEVDFNKSNIDYGGEIERLQESSSNLLLIFLLALIFIYLVLCAQFESFTDPLIILFSVPFSITGGVAALLLLRDSINMYSNIGLITLIGLITKNAIMLVEFTSNLRNDENMPVFDALIKAASIRLRPILMTTLATIFGALPLVISSGAGAGARRSIGITIVGGMIVGSLFTIFVIPMIYNIFKGENRERIKR